jgi:hypothetical protein
MSFWAPSEVHQETDGTWTVCLALWSAKEIKGMPTRDVAVTALETAHEAMRIFPDDVLMHN